MLVLAALADPVRREIVEMLASGEVSAGVIADRFPISRPAISRHLRVLREAGLVRSEVRGQHRLYVLERAALADLDRWLDAFRPLEPTERLPVGPAGRLDALDTELHRGRRQCRTADPRGADDDRSVG